MGESKKLLFEPSFNRAVKVRGGQDRLTSDAGTLLLREADHRLGLTQSLSAFLMADGEEIGYWRKRWDLEAWMVRQWRKVKTVRHLTPQDYWAFRELVLTEADVRRLEKAIRRGYLPQPLGPSRDWRPPPGLTEEIKRTRREEDLRIVAKCWEALRANKNVRYCSGW